MVFVVMSSCDKEVNHLDGLEFSTIEDQPKYSVDTKSIDPRLENYVLLKLQSMEMIRGQVVKMSDKELAGIQARIDQIASSKVLNQDDRIFLTNIIGFERPADWENFSALENELLNEYPDFNKTESFLGYVDSVSDYSLLLKGCESDCNQAYWTTGAGCIAAGAANLLAGLVCAAINGGVYAACLKNCNIE